MTARRDFLAFTAGAVAAKTVLPLAARAEVRHVSAPSEHPDAELIAVCAEFDRLEQAYIDRGGDYEPGSPEDDAAEAERDRLSAAQDPLVARMCELRATTREGQAARARSLALWNAELLKPGSGDTGTCLTAAIVRDLLAGSAMA